MKPKPIAPNEFSDEQAAILGRRLATIFCMKRDLEHRDRWQMSLGNKTNLGLFRTFERIAADIANGKGLPI